MRRLGHPNPPQFSQNLTLTPRSERLVYCTAAKSRRPPKPSIRGAEQLNWKRRGERSSQLTEQTAPHPPQPPHKAGGAAARSRGLRAGTRRRRRRCGASTGAPPPPPPPRNGGRRGGGEAKADEGEAARPGVSLSSVPVSFSLFTVPRSEERRVGKECSW